MSDTEDLNTVLLKIVDKLQKRAEADAARGLGSFQTFFEAAKIVQNFRTDACKKGAGNFYYRIEGDVVEVYEGNPDEIGLEAESVLIIDKTLVDSLVLTLNKIQSVIEKR